MRDPAQPSNRPMDPKHILVVDDDPNILTLIRTILSQKDYRVTTALSGEQAMNSLTQEKFDAIITDALMPHMDGTTLAKTVKNDPHLRDLPIIMVTASKEVDIVKKSFASGCVLFLPKPFTASSLLSLIQLVLK
ncbi:MAG TPA: response regulator [Terriglobia bacterium]|nr:response regulator [Terriglobia bacterium]